MPEYLGKCFKQLEIYHGIRSYQDILLFSLIFILRAVFKLVRNQLTFGIGNDVVFDLRLKAVKSLLESKKPQRNKVIDYSILSYDLNYFSEIISYRTFVFIESLLIFIFSFYGMYRTSPVVTIIVLPFILLLVLISSQFSKKMTPIIKSVRNSIDRITEITFENINGQEVIKALNAQDSEFTRFDTANRIYMKNTLAMTNTYSKYAPLIDTNSYIALIACIFTASILVFIGRLDISSILVFQGYMILLFDVVGFLSETIEFYSNSRESLLRVSTYMKPDISEKQRKGVEVEEQIREVELRQINMEIKIFVNKKYMRLQKNSICMYTWTGWKMVIKQLWVIWAKLCLWGRGV